MSKNDCQDHHLIYLDQGDIFQIRALCDEMMSSLCQAKALLAVADDENFFQRLDAEVLRHYFYALDAIVDAALLAKDKTIRLIDHWEVT